MENSTLFIRNTGQGTIGQLNGFEARGTSGVEVNLKGFNTIYMENSNTADTALQVNSGTLTEQGKGGNAILNIEGSLNIYTKGNKGGFERDGIEVNAYNGNVILNHAGSGAIQSSAGNAVYAKQRAGNGNVVINLNSLSGKDNIVLITAGDSKGPSAWMGNHGISAAITLANTIGNINVFSNAKISTTGKGAKGIYSHHNGIGENNIENQGTILTVSDNAYGIHALANNSNSKGQNFIANQGDITTNGIKATGIFNENRSLGNNLINNTGTILTTGNEAYTIHSVNSNINSAGNMVITNSGNLTTQGTDADGINVNNAGLKTVQVQNSGNIITTGNDSQAIFIDNTNVNSNAETIIKNDGNLTISGKNTQNKHIAGIYVNNVGTGKVSVLNNGDINSSFQGIRINNNGDTVIDNVGNIITNNNGNSNIHNHGIYIAPLKDGTTAIINHYGNIKVNGLPYSGGNSIGIAVDSVTLNTNVTFNLASNSTVDASNGRGGVQISTTGEGIVNLAANSTLKGGITYGIYLSNGDIAINNEGNITAVNDQALLAVDTKSAIVKNIGSITGYITTNSNNSALDLDNTGIFKMRNQIDSTFTKDSVIYTHDTKKVAISWFNGGIINNKGVIQLMAVNGLANDITGEYTPDGAVSSIKEGIQHGQFLDVREFRNSGVLDLLGSGLSGNVMVISGSDIAGTNGNGIFITDGGTLKVSTTLNEGGIASRSDMLVVDNLKKGTGPTAVDLTIATGSKDEKTIDNGIQIVKTLGTQDKGAFTLLNPVTYGRYEYLLYGNDAVGIENGYYLRNKLDDFVDPINPPKYLPNPNIGAYLGNQYAAADMFNQNILDRRDNVRAADQTVWGRVQYNELKTNHINNTQKLKIENTLIQLGIDLYQDYEKGQIAGVYAGYGKSDVTNISRLTGTKAEGSVDGFQLGAYYSWMPQENQGPYVDVWGHYATYRNKLHGKTQRGLEKKYDGYGFAVSAEAGYGFVIDESSYTKWVLEPHAQVTYNHINMDDFTDHNNTRFSNNKGKGFDIRLGARFYGYHPDDNGVLPFVELNWLHNGMDNAVYVNGHKEDSRIGRNVGELKLGLKGNLSKESSVFAHVGLEKGNNKYQRTKFQIGFNYNW